MDDKISLYLVATPIGNLGDISKRTVEVLKSVDFIAAEDTRNTLKLLNYMGIKKPLISYFEHNKRQRGEEILQRVLKGQTCALVSDAGMPAISDPGEDLVSLFYENNLLVSVIPGPCALVSALVVSGLSTKRFTFEGFLSTTKKNRTEHLSSLKYEKRTMIFYESPKKLLKTLIDLKEIFGNRKIALVREITKKYEEVIRCDLENAVSLYSEKEPLGEFVLVLEGAADDSEKEEFWSNFDIQQHVLFYENSGLSKMEAIKACAKDRKLRKSDIYKEIHGL